ncbi:hypothetical protein TOPH_07271 [Tolypocladium ophioglossoides CBS 100239]|uniref:Protein kinase domain-containing protein n=1 Tax=Tolypocladium ophioglossoides (strain CBS 100239) TaxID=1163406 RepID=A0A0L0N2N0_TOLOC|nr:hypothetical protein TOPH_07271 [Tolypocladium ophioglossoides CBS 100239]
MISTRKISYSTSTTRSNLSISTIRQGSVKCYEPYVRQHRKVVGGIYGNAGPVTEQFALGSVFWYMTRGSELYSELEGPDQVDCLLDDIFPTTNPDDPIDKIIRNCWNGHYLRIADLWTTLRMYWEREYKFKESFLQLRDMREGGYVKGIIRKGGLGVRKTAITSLWKQPQLQKLLEKGWSLLMAWTI